MNLKEAIELYRSKEKSKYPAENWVRIGQYLEPHLDHMIWLSDNRTSVAKSEIEYYEKTIKELRRNVKDMLAQREEIVRGVVATMDKVMKNTDSTKKDIVSAMDKYCISVIRKTPSI